MGEKATTTVGALENLGDSRVKKGHEAWVNFCCKTEELLMLLSNTRDKIALLELYNEEIDDLSNVDEKTEVIHEGRILFREILTSCRKIQTEFKIGEESDLPKNPGEVAKAKAIVNKAKQEWIEDIQTFLNNFSLNHENKLSLYFLMEELIEEIRQI